mmetsp:Transcript_33953/g.55446  ORF Transcript_33953/g.55446 Transcript_33953/m.55446 type:complete len:387 (+) Transcript_33953:25-1185(+)
MLDTSTVLAKYFSFHLDPGSIKIGVIAVQGMDTVFHFEAKDGGECRAEIHLLEASTNRRILKILIPRRKIRIPLRNVTISHQVFVRRASDTRRTIAKRPLRPLRHGTFLDALILQKITTGAQCKGGILCHFVVGTVPSRVLEEGECECGDVLCGAGVYCRHEFIIEQSVIPMASKAIGITRRLILQPPSHHFLTIKLIPHNVRHRLRHHLIRNISIRGCYRFYRIFRCCQHRLPRAIHAQHFFFGRPIPIIAGSARFLRRMTVEKWKVIAIHSQYMSEFMSDCQEAAFVRFGGSIRGIHGPEANSGISHCGPVQLIVLAIRGKGEGLQLTAALRVILFDFGAEIGSFHGNDDYHEVNVIVHQTVALGSQLHITIGSNVGNGASIYG